MTIKCLGTGSKGNCYILTSASGKQIILECGIKYEKIIANIKGFDTLEGVLISHEHTDHNAKVGKKRVSDLFEQSLIPVYQPTNCVIGKLYKLGDFSFIPLECKHNVVCYGYLILVDGKTMLFATDTQVLPKVNIICDYYLVEVNYDMASMEEVTNKLLTDSADEVPYHLGSIYKNHSCLESVEDYFRFTLKGQKAKKIMTIHASNSHLLDKSKVYFKLNQFSNDIIVVEGGQEILC